MNGKGAEWPELVQMIGAEFRTHHQQAEITATVIDHKHPANEGVGATWTAKDEIYLLKNYNIAKLHILAFMTTNPMDTAADQGKPGPPPRVVEPGLRAGAVVLHHLGPPRRRVAERELPGAPHRRHRVGAGPQRGRLHAPIRQRQVDRVGIDGSGPGVRRLAPCWLSVWAAPR